MTYDDLVALLEPVGIPVMEPGAQTSALPCIAIEPIGMGTEAGYSWLYDECEIKVIVPMAQNNGRQFELLRDYTVEVWRQLWGTKVQVDSDGPLFGEAETDPASLFFQLTVRFPGEDLCRVDPMLPSYLTDQDGNFLTTIAGDLLTT